MNETRKRRITTAADKIRREEIRGWDLDLRHTSLKILISLIPQFHIVEIKAVLKSARRSAAHLLLISVRDGLGKGRVTETHQEEPERLQLRPSSRPLGKGAPSPFP